MEESCYEIQAKKDLHRRKSSAVTPNVRTEMSKNCKLTSRIVATVCTAFIGLPMKTIWEFSML